MTARDSTTQPAIAVGRNGSWTHDIEELVKLAGLRAERDTDASANPALLANWQVVKDWSELARYERKTKLHAEELYEAVAHATNGVLPWIKNHW